MVLPPLAPSDPQPSAATPHPIRRKGVGGWLGGLLSLIVLGLLGTVPAVPPRLPDPAPPPGPPLSTTVRGYTVTLYPVYADANHLVLTYTVAQAAAGGAGTDYAPAALPAYLRDAAGRAFPPLEAAASGGPYFGPRIAPQGWAAAPASYHVLVFDTALYPALPAVLDLQLDLPTIQVWQMAPINSIRWEIGQRAVAVHFHFCMPFDPVRRLAYIGQPREFADPPPHAVTKSTDSPLVLNTESRWYQGARLDQVVVTRHSARVFWYNSLPTSLIAESTLWTCCPFIELDTPTSHTRIGPETASAPLITAWAVHNPALFSDPGPWQLTLFWETGEARMNPRAPASPAATFRFTVPPLDSAAAATPEPMITPTPARPVGVIPYRTLLQIPGAVIAQGESDAPPFAQASGYRIEVLRLPPAYFFAATQGPLLVNTVWRVTLTGHFSPDRAARFIWAGKVRLEPAVLTEDRTELRAITLDRAEVPEGTQLRYSDATGLGGGTLAVTVHYSAAPP